MNYNYLLSLGIVLLILGLSLRVRMWYRVVKMELK
jgi:hypothetical protein